MLIAKHLASLLYVSIAGIAVVFLQVFNDAAMGWIIGGISFFGGVLVTTGVIIGTTRSQLSNLTKLAEEAKENLDAMPGLKADLKNVADKVRHIESWREDLFRHPNRIRGLGNG